MFFFKNRNTNKLSPKDISRLIGENLRLFPTQLAIETIRNCNARCIMCPSEHMKRPKGRMDAAAHRLIIDKTAAWGAPIDFITHAGMGEPLLDAELEQKIKYEKSVFPQATVVIYSNGSLLSAERSDRLTEAGVDVFSFSINGFRPHTYETVMKLPRDKTYDNVTRFIEYNKSRGASVKVHVSLVKTGVCSDAEVAEYKEYWQGKADEVILPPWIDWGGEIGGCGTNMGGRLPCCYIWKVLMVDYDGTIKLCCEDYDSRYPLGNLLHDEPGSIFNSPQMLLQRKAQLSGSFEQPPICRCCRETAEEVVADFWRSFRPIPASRREGKD